MIEQSLQPHTNLPPLGDYSADSVDPRALALEATPGWVQLLSDIRGPHGFEDGLPPSLAPLRNGLSRAHIGELWLRRRHELTDNDIGAAACSHFVEHLDVAASKGVTVEKADPGEPIEHYMNRIASGTLRLPPRETDSDVRLKTPHPVHVPGSRFDDWFPADSAVVYQGFLAIGDVPEGLRILDNIAHDTMRLGYPGNFGRIAMLRTQTPLDSFAVEALSGLYGQEALRHYHKAQVRNLEFWNAGRERLAGIPLGRHGAVRRVARMPGGETLYRNADDAYVNYATRQGVREESAHEDLELGDRLVHSITDEGEKAHSWERLMRSLRAACESWQDMSDYQLTDSKNLITSHTIEICTSWLQAALAHKIKIVAEGYEALGEFHEAEKRWKEFNSLKVAVNRLMWRSIDETHGHYTDVSLDGTQTGSLNAAQILPLLVGNDFVPYDRAIMTINTWRNTLLGDYGLHTSAIPDCLEQWSGDREWPSLAMLAIEAAMQAAVDAKRNGQDPKPFLHFADDLKYALTEGIGAWYRANRTIPERINGSNPREVALGGEYYKKKSDDQPVKAQTGFGMTIGAYRVANSFDPFEVPLDPHDGPWLRQGFAAIVGRVAARFH